MALTNNGTAVYLDASYLPSGYTKPTVTKFTDAEYISRDIVVPIGKTGVDESAAAVTFAALVAALTVAISAIITADYNVSGLTVTAFANLKSVDSNFDLANVMYTTGAINYNCTVDIFVKTAAL